MKRIKKIKFTSSYPEVEILHPFPASKAIPEWYRKMPRVNSGHPTVKTCIPFLDAMTAGYIVPLAADVVLDGETAEYNSNATIPVISSHFPEQTEFVKIPDHVNPSPLKWGNSFYIKTPKGYSCYITHPANREDLPFTTLTGVVDTDVHPVIINFPFLVNKDFKGVIPAGTPIAQIIPFKRDDWKIEVVDDKEPPHYPASYELLAPPYNLYKRKWWQKKKYN
jgi:hypothetical protein